MLTTDKLRSRTVNLKKKPSPIRILDEPKLLMAVYGTLRVSGSAKWYIESLQDTKLIRTALLKGYRMYDLGPFPMVMECSNPDDTIEVDIIKVTKHRFESIARMEMSAGYKGGSTQDQDDDKDNGLCIWLAGPRWETRLAEQSLNPGSNHFPLVKSGDWLKYREARE